MSEEHIIEQALSIDDSATKKPGQQSDPELNQIEATMSSIALTESAQTPGNALREQLLQSVQQPHRFDAFIARLSDFLDLSADRVKALLLQIELAPNTPWQTSELPDICFLPFQGGPKTNGRECFLMHMQPGHTFPEHRHHGDEWGFVLQGQIQEDSGRCYAPGDMVYRSADDTHALTATGDQPFVFAVILQGGIEWT